MSDPPAGEALDNLVAPGRAAGHDAAAHAVRRRPRKSDVPAVVVEGRRRHPGLDIRYGRPLGVDHALCADGPRQPRRRGCGGLPLLVIARGTSDPDANAEAHRAARLLAEFERAPFVVTGFSGVTWPGYPRRWRCAPGWVPPVAVFSWFLCNGKLVQRILDDEAAFVGRTASRWSTPGTSVPIPGWCR